MTKKTGLMQRLKNAGKVIKGSLTLDEIFENFFDGGFQSSSGQAVSERNVVQLSTVYSCVNVLAETLGTLSLKMYRKLRDGTKEEISDSSSSFLLDKPNCLLDSFEWRERMVWRLALQGRDFYFKNRIGSRVRELVLIDDYVDVKVNRDTGKYEFTLNGEVYGLEDILYLTAHQSKSVIALQRDTFGKAQAVAKYAASFFKNGAAPRTVIKSPKEFETEDGAERFLKQWRDWYQGDGNWNRTGMLTGGKELIQIPISNDDAQFLETNQYTDNQICGIFRVPPHMVGIMDRATFNNIEYQGANFARFSMLPWCRRVETALNVQLVKPMDGTEYYCEFLVDSLERGDTKSRYEAYKIAREAGFLSTNDIRRRENYSSVAGGDDYQAPMNSNVSKKESKE